MINSGLSFENCNYSGGGYIKIGNFVFVSLIIIPTVSNGRIYIRGLPKAIKLTPLNAFNCYKPEQNVNSNTSFVNSIGEVQIIVDKMEEFSVGGIYLGNH